MSATEQLGGPGRVDSSNSDISQGVSAANTKAIFQEQGYIVLGGLLDPGSDLEPVSEAYSDLVDELAIQVCGAALEQVIPGYADLDFPSRLAGLAGVTRGSVFDHLAPGLNIFERGYKRWRNAPSAQPEALFGLMANEKILDAVESVIGPEIWATPAYHLNFKLAAKHRKIQQQSEVLAKILGVFNKRVLEPVEFVREFQLGQTPWHMDAYPGLGEPDTHDYIVVWVSMTRANTENGTLKILPRSHLNGYCTFPQERENEAIAIEAKAGDVVIMNSQTFHASMSNQSPTNYRWAINMRYMPPDRPYGKRFLPGFTARSLRNPELVLKDAGLWSKSWDAALEYLDRYELPMKHQFFRTVEETLQLDEYWRQRVPDYESWLTLHRHGSRWKAVRCSFRKAIDRCYGWLLSYKEHRKKKELMGSE